MKAKRTLSIDLLKLAASFRVVFVHLAPSTPAALSMTALLFFGVPFFLLISVYFFVQRIKKLPKIRFSDLRLDRILVPYATWSVIYTLMRLLKCTVTGERLEFDPIGFALFGGSAVQLYFISLLLLFQAQALAILLLFRSGKYRLSGLCVAIGTALFAYAGSSGGHFGFANAMQKSLLYVALAFLLGWTQSKPAGRRFNGIVGWMTVGVILVNVFLRYEPAFLGMAFSPLVAYGVAALALNWRIERTGSFLPRIASCSYGIFLAHFGFLETFEFVFERLGIGLTPYTALTKLLLGSLIVLCCYGLILIARLHWLPAYLLFGESRHPASPVDLARSPEAQIPATPSGRA